MKQSFLDIKNMYVFNVCCVIVEYFQDKMLYFEENIAFFHVPDFVISNP